jgi:archaellum component FlaC
MALTRLERGLEEFKDEMLGFKNEMLEFKNEMLEFKNEMLGFKDEMSEFKDEMLEFKNEMSEFKNESKRMNKQWGHLAQKMGMLVEDMVIPSLPAVIEDRFGMEIETMSSRIIQRHPTTKQRKEYDAIAVAGDYVFLNFTTSRLLSRDIEEFAKEIEELREFFPEYKEKKIIGILAIPLAEYPDASVITYAERSGFLVLGLGDWLMEVKNSEGFTPKEW